MKLDMDFANVKPGVVNALIILAIVIITVPMAKVAFGKFYVPGVSELVASI